MKSFVRVGLDGFYYEIARENYARYFEFEKEAASLKLDDPLDLAASEFEIRTNQDKCALIAICFSAMCVEAFIYDYAARHTSDSYVQKYLDRLDLAGKWVVIPKLVTGKEFPRNSTAFDSLKFLIKMRNKLVHFKSSNPPTEQEILTKGLSHERDDTTKTVKRCFEAIKQLFDELQRMDPQNEFEGCYAFEKWSLR
jgi:hypothetical protein